MSDKLQILLDLGFENVGTWTLHENDLTYALSRSVPEKNILYAFVAGQQVMYIGKSTKTLSARMKGYQKPGSSQRTNITNNNHIRVRLKDGVPVHILVFVPTERVDYRGIPINIAAGLEDILIERTAPPWNRVGNGLVDEQSS